MRSAFVLFLFANALCAADPPTAPVVAKWELPQSAGRVTALAWLPDGTAIVGADERETVHIWDAATGRETAILAPPGVSGKDRNIALAVNREGTVVAIAHDVIGLRLWDRASGRERRVANQELFPTIKGGTRLVDVAFVGDAGQVAVATKEGAMVHVSSDGKLVGSPRRMPQSFGKGERALIRHEFAFERESGLALPAQLGLAYYEGHEIDELRLWDFTKGRLVATTSLRELAQPWVVAFATDGSRAVVRNIMNSDSRQELLVFDVATLKEIGSIEVAKRKHEVMVYAGFSGDGRLLLVRQFDGSVVVYDTARLTPLANLASGHMWRWSFSRDGRKVATNHAEPRVTIHDLRAAVDPNPPKDLDASACWNDLASANGATAMRAVYRLADRPAETAKLIREKLKPVAKPGEAELAKWLAALSAPAFAERQAATKKLAAVADAIGPELKQEAAKNASPESVEAINTMLETADRSRRKLEGDYLRAYRAVQVLEMIGTPAKDLLKGYAAGAKGAFLTQEAERAMGRSK